MGRGRDLSSLSPPVHCFKSQHAFRSGPTAILGQKERKTRVERSPPWRPRLSAVTVPLSLPLRTLGTLPCGHPGFPEPPPAFLPAAAIHGKNLVAILHLLIALATHFRAPIRLPEHVSVQVVVVRVSPPRARACAHVTSPRGFPSCDFFPLERLPSISPLDKICVSPWLRGRRLEEQQWR